MQYLRSVLKYIVTFILTLAVLTLFMISSAMVPRDDVQDNMLQSAKYMNNHPAMFMLVDSVPSSKIDHFADCVTLSIAYYLDENDPVKSAMWTSFYGAFTTQMNEFLWESVTTDVPDNQEYLRYWHGSAACMRFMHLFTSLPDIYVFHAVLMAVLFLLLLFLLIRRKYYSEAVAFTIAMIAVDMFYVPFCLEYTYTVLWMLTACIIALILTEHQKYQWYGVFFLITGMVTNFVDFLTAETLTLLVPLLLILRLQYCPQLTKPKMKWCDSLKFSTLWLIGYAGMWVMKWVLASIVLHQNVLPLITEHVIQRINGPVTGTEIYGNKYSAAVLINLKKLFPLEYGFYGAVFVLCFILLVVVIPVATGRVELREKIIWSNAGLFAVIGLMPYIRFLILHNHSYVHGFFTHRAQAATVMALVFIVFEIIEWRDKKLISV